ncbi:kinetochore-associated Ndc80 complex subunit nuf2 [Malassezia yamatoensis]|uniref:Kinetochore-associated Ndc80 complex subunit nuf2 n=1 Tax=Malassezia yamatoensis TaxID=253288 RepID=A0AAJ5YRL5_9BASI|nr:kinetochore-associated Ndc80 complex subunit nuf2 [Malassezia yamatoensis]
MYTSFPAVKTDELLSVLQEMGLSVSVEEIAKPQSTMVQRVYMGFLDTLAGTMPEMLDERRDEACAEMEHGEIFEDGVAWLLFYREVRAMMEAATVTDFHLQDLTRPTAKRFKRHMSALVNFFRFRSDRLAEFDELVVNTEELENKRLELEENNERVQHEIQSILAQRRADEGPVQELREANLECSDQLLRRKKQQTKLLAEIEQLKTEKTRLSEQQTNLQYEVQMITTELSKLQARISSRPDDLRKQIGEMHTQVEQERKSLRETEAKAQTLSKKVEVIKQLDSDITQAITLMEQVAAEQECNAREQRALEETQRAVQTHEEQRHTIEDRLAQLDRHTEQLTAQVDQNRKALEAKRHASQTRLDALTTRLADVSRLRKERHVLVEVRGNEAQAIEQDMESILQAHEAHYAKMQLEKQALCRTASSYMDALTRAMEQA